MSLTLLIVLITAVVAGIGFWFYNRRQISSLTETIEDKNAVISSFRDHLTPVVEESIPQTFTNVDLSEVIDLSIPTTHQKSEKKKKRYSNRPKKNGNGNNQNTTKSEPKQKEKSNQTKPEKNSPNKGRKPKKQQ
jgi:regulator of replication initiation timing